MASTNCAASWAIWFEIVWASTISCHVGTRSASVTGTACTAAALRERIAAGYMNRTSTRSTAWLRSTSRV